MTEGAALTTFLRAPGAAGAQVDGETVVLSPTDLRYHSLNDPAAAIWGLLAEPRSLEDIVGRLLEHFEVDPAVCEADAAACLAELGSLGIVAQRS